MSGQTFALDSSCMVAAVCTWHENHTVAARAIEERFAADDRLAVAAHAVAETYAVLTRLPPPHRLSPVDAWTLVNTNFIEGASVIALDGHAYAALLARVAASGLGGGRTYDAIIAECAVQARASTLLTFNPRHFEPPPAGITVVEPSA